MSEQRYPAAYPPGVSGVSDSRSLSTPHGRSSDGGGSARWRGDDQRSVVGQSRRSFDDDDDEDDWDDDDDEDDWDDDDDEDDWDDDDDDEDEGYDDGDDRGRSTKPSQSATQQRQLEEQRRRQWQQQQQQQQHSERDFRRAPSRTDISDPYDSGIDMRSRSSSPVSSGREGDHRSGRETSRDFTDGYPASGQTHNPYLNRPAPSYDPSRPTSQGRDYSPDTTRRPPSRTDTDGFDDERGRPPSRTEASNPAGTRITDDRDPSRYDYHISDDENRARRVGRPKSTEITTAAPSSSTKKRRQSTSPPHHRPTDAELRKIYDTLSRTERDECKALSRSERTQYLMDKDTASRETRAAKRTKTATTADNDTTSPGKAVDRRFRDLAKTSSRATDLWSLCSSLLPKSVVKKSRVARKYAKKYPKYAAQTLSEWQKSLGDSGQQGSTADAMTVDTIGSKLLSTFQKLEAKDLTQDTKLTQTERDKRISELSRHIESSFANLQKFQSTLKSLGPDEETENVVFLPGKEVRYEGGKVITTTRRIFEVENKVAERLMKEGKATRAPANLRIGERGKSGTSSATSKGTTKGDIASTVLDTWKSQMSRYLDHTKA